MDRCPFVEGSPYVDDPPLVLLPLVEACVEWSRRAEEEVLRNPRRARNLLFLPFVLEPLVVFGVETDGLLRHLSVALAEVQGLVPLWCYLVSVSSFIYYAHTAMAEDLLHWEGI